MGKCRLNGKAMAEKKNNITTLILVAGVVGAIIFMLSEGVNVDFWKKRISSLTGRDATQLQISTPALESEASNQLKKVRIDKQETVQLSGKRGNLNEKGVSLVLKKKLWEGMYCFEQAIREDPSDLAALINMIAVLSELGLSKPVERYIGMAREIDSRHPLLQSMFSDEIYENRKEEVAGTANNMDQKQSMSDLTRDLHHSGVRLWGEDLLMLWGIDDSRLY